MRELLPSLKLMRGSLLKMLLLGLLLSCVTSLAAIGLRRVQPEEAESTAAATGSSNR